MKKIYITAAFFALITGLLVYNFAQTLEKKAMIEYTEIVVAAEHIPVRTVITEKMLTTKSIPSEAVHPNALKDPKIAVGLISAGIIEQGEMISASKVHSQENRDNTMGYFVPTGMRAITLSVDETSGISGFIMPGDRVDIIASLVLEQEKDDETVSVSTSFVLAQNIEVLASGINTKISPNVRNLAYSSITLAVTPEDALNISHSTINGRLRFILRSASDDTVNEVNPVNADNILSRIQS